jgi:hypothetical protein
MIKNRFYIEVRSVPEIQVGDMEWAKLLLLLNLWLQREGFHHLGAYLEETKKNK